MDNTELRMTIGRPIVSIQENESFVFLADWAIPKGTTKECGEERRRIVWEMYEIWKLENPTGSVFNTHEKMNIILNTVGVKETAAHAFINYKNVIAFYCIDRILTSARHVKYSNLNSNTQKKEFKGGKMAQMTAKISAKPFFGTAKVMVGIHRNNKRTLYSVTFIDIDT